MIHHGDCLDVMRQMEADSVDAIVTDPPYGLKFMGARNPWDYDVPGVDVWRECFRVLKPGGRLLSFAGTRTMHRMWVNIEDAGFTIEDTIAWIYGSGFPKHKSKLKPAFEPVAVARKGPVSVLNVDATRIGTEQTVTRHTTWGGEPGWGGERRSTGETTAHAGRWPANLILDEESARQLDAQSGVLKTNAGTYRRNKEDARVTRSAYAIDPQAGHVTSLGDSGGASRYFKVVHPEEADEIPERFLYQAKASRAERNVGLMDPGPARKTNQHVSGINGANLRPPGSNGHPTVKPVALMRWLVRLVTPPGGLVLDPFAGSGSTGVACVLEGFQFVGIEREADYCEIARRRIAAAVPEQGNLLDGAA